MAFVLAFNAAPQTAATLYTTSSANVKLYSHAPLEDIEAESNKGKSVLNIENGTIMFSVSVRSFKFQKSLMQEHFNENYMESDKYPQATFKGKILQMPDVTQNGTYDVKATGVFEVHGVKQNRTIGGRISVTNGKPVLTCEFMVRCADHNIEIPKLVFAKIAETVKINVTAAYLPYTTNNAN